MRMNICVLLKTFPNIFFITELFDLQVCINAKIIDIFKD